MTPAFDGTSSAFERIGSYLGSAGARERLARAVHVGIDVSRER